MKIIEFIKNNKKVVIILSAVVLAMAVSVTFLCVYLSTRSVPTLSIPDETTDYTETEAEIVETVDLSQNEDEIIPFEKRSNGIDVSKWQGKINWETVKRKGIYFAFIRVGYRGENGEIYEDEYAAYNIQQAEKNGILVGVYFFSTAINESEAEEEADWVLNYIKGYSISYPVVHDCEGYKVPTSRMFGVSSEERTNNALVFLNKISEAGYDTMLYGARNELQNSFYWLVDRIAEEHKIWVAQYSDAWYPYKDRPDYLGRCDAWQFTNSGRIDGIDADVDLVVCYFVCEKSLPKDSEETNLEVDAPEVETKENEDVYYGIQFYPHKDRVTAKILVNLRSEPSTEAGSVVGSLKSGEFVDRVAMSDKGWSRLIYKGQTVYAVSSYLSNEVIEQQTGNSSDVQLNGFEPVSDIVTAKIETNLRTLPNTVDSTVVYTLKNGEYLNRVGLNTASGWSMLEYNGMIVYAISSYLEIKENLD